MSPRRIPRLRVLALLALVLALVATSCAVGDDEPFLSNPDVAGADDETPSGPAALSDPVCDEQGARASRPLDPAGLDVDLAGTRMQDIIDSGTLRAGVAQDTLLFGFFNPGSGAIEGFDIEIARLVADALAVQLELVPILSADRIPLLQSGALDIVVKTMTITCTRWAEIDFSTEYFKAGQQLLLSTEATETDMAQMTGERICAAEGTTSIAKIREFEEQGTVEAVAVGGWTDCLVKFQQGEVEGISTDDTILAGLAVQDPFAMVTEFDPAITDEPYGIGVSQEYPEFTQYINAVLEQARTDGTWQDLYDQELRAILGERTPPVAEYRTG